MIYKKCNCCGRDETSPIKKEGEWQIVQCMNCGLVYVNPQPDENFLKKHYQSYLPGKEKEIFAWEKMMSDVFSRSWRIIENTYGDNPPGKLLDIGCAHGFFLDTAKKRGWEVSGIDLSEHAVKYANQKGLNVSNSSLFDKNYRDEEFDIVTMFYVLEHVIDPSKYIKEVCRILRPGGIFLLRVPDTTPIVKLLKFLRIPNALYDAPSHLTDFSPKILKEILQDAGLKNVKTCIGGTTLPDKPLEKITSLFFGTLAEFLNIITFSRYLFPGVSKTTIALK